MKLLNRKKKTIQTTASLMASPLILFEDVQRRLERVCPDKGNFRRFKCTLNEHMLWFFLLLFCCNFTNAIEKTMFHSIQIWIPSESL